MIFQQPKHKLKKVGIYKTKKTKKRESLNIKITRTLNLRIKRARETARKNDLQFNVSRLVEEFLEKELLITQDINDEKNKQTYSNTVKLPFYRW